MGKKINREQLIALATQVIGADGTEEEINEVLRLLERNVPHPAVSDLVFYPEDEMSVQQIVDAALAYKPMKLG